MSEVHEVIPASDTDAPARVEVDFYDLDHSDFEIFLEVDERSNDAFDETGEILTLLGHVFYSLS